MKIVVLDGYGANPGDLSWTPLEELGVLTVYPRTRADEVVSRAADADIVIPNKVILDIRITEVEIHRRICHRFQHDRY